LTGDQGELALCISVSTTSREAQITAYTPINTSQNPAAHIDAYLQRTHIEHAKNSFSSISSEVSQLLSSVFDTPSHPSNVSGVAHSVFAGKKYKPVAQKIRAVLADLPEKFRIVRNIIGDPLKDMPILPQTPLLFEPSAHYTLEHKAKMDANHPEGFLWPAE